jgi:DNA-binding beta-propeller fold protein YncE
LKPKKSKILIIISILSILLWGSFAFTVTADNDYILVDGKRRPIPKTYILEKVIYNPVSIENEEEYLKHPQDIFIDNMNYIYVADTGNNRIVKLSPEGETDRIYKGIPGSLLKLPEGVFVDDLGDIFIADTGNTRILHLSKDGEFVEEFLEPESNLLGEFFTFTPSKLCISKTGYIYVVKGQSILILDAYNNFRGYLGQTDIGFNLTEALIRIFASAEQKKFLQRRTAASYNNIFIDEKGTIYATSKDTIEGEIKKLNSIGKNIYRKYTTAQRTFEFKLLGLSEIDLEDQSFIFGERFDDEGKPIQPLFNDITVDSKGNVTVVENNTGKLYQYDKDGNLLTVFGGLGNQKGKFHVPVAIAEDSNGKIYVLDGTLGSIQIFEPTAFIKLIHQAVDMNNKGNYEEAFDIWNQVLKFDESYHLAHFGLANALLKQEDWKGAMEEYKLANDRQGYSKAHSEYRYNVFRQNFAMVLLIFGLAIFLIVKLLSLMKKIHRSSNERFSNNMNKKMGILTGLGMSFGIIFHPMETLDNIKSGRERLNYLSGFIILLGVLAVRILYLFTVHYPLMDIDLQKSNFSLETVKLLLPPLTWMAASFAITAILDGESKFGEIFISTTYCMVPYILVFSLLPALSKILSRNERIFYAVIINSTWIWILLLFFISLKVLNDYSVKKTLVVEIKRLKSF